MKVILLEDVKALGKKGQVVEVSDGYAKNFILKKKLGLEATGANMNDLKLQKARDEKVAQQQLDAAKEQAALLEERLARAERHSAPYPARKSQLPTRSSVIWKLIKRKFSFRSRSRPSACMKCP